MTCGNFTFLQHDLRDHNETPQAVSGLLAGVRTIDLVVLNAGILGPIADLSDTDLNEIKFVFEINVWANKILLDTIFHAGITIPQVVTISSGASLSGYRGWGAYSLSKTALNMLTRLYASENPTTHFCAVSPGPVDTGMQDLLRGLPDDERFPTLKMLKDKRETREMPDPAVLAEQLLELCSRLPASVKSGEYIDIREFNKTNR